MPARKGAAAAGTVAAVAPAARRQAAATVRPEVRPPRAAARAREQRTADRHTAVRRIVAAADTIRSTATAGIPTTATAGIRTTDMAATPTTGMVTAIRTTRTVI